MSLRCAVLALAALCPLAWAQTPAPERASADPVALQKSVERGGKLVQICANCHGANGNSRTPDTPNLAGQNATYLQEQMHRFVDGRRKDVFMQGMIRAMNATERADVVAFLASQVVQPQTTLAAPAAQLALGRRYYEQVCFRCHGAQALGDAKVPRLAGQQTGYVVKSLKRYRDGTGERLEPLMAANTKLMSDNEIAAVAAYLSSMR
jgi:cytochrome c553